MLLLLLIHALNAALPTSPIIGIALVTLLLTVMRYGTQLLICNRTYPSLA